MDKFTRYLLAGGILILAGVVLTILGKMLALILFLLGLGLLAAGFSFLLKRGDYSGDGVYFHGLWGQGRQQSEAVKLDSALPAENSGIWDKMEQGE